MDKYDLIVIGAGSAGSGCAEKVNKNGLRVALIERDALGGTCLNYGCDPTKAALHAASILHRADHAQDYGLYIPQASVDWETFKERIWAIQDEFRGGTKQEARKMMRDRGIDLIIGEATFVSQHEIEVNGRRLQADNFLIATGNEPAIPDIPGLPEAGYITNQDVFNLPNLPKTLAIMGGGPIGVEFAQLFARLGTKVHLFEPNNQILPRDDPELVAELTQVLTREGVRIETGASVSAVSPSEIGKKVTITFNSGYEEIIEVEQLLVAAGRKSAIAELNLKEIGVEIEEDLIKTDATLRTSLPHIWAAGDVTADYPFTHVAWRQGAHVAKNILHSDNILPFPFKHIPWVTYTDPELAHIGQLESQLQETGIPYRVLNVSMEKNARAVATGEKDGRIKLFIGKDERVLGGHILAANGGDLIGTIILAMQADLPISAIGDTVFPYPTSSTILGKVANSG